MDGNNTTAGIPVIQQAVPSAAPVAGAPVMPAPGVDMAPPAKKRNGALIETIILVLVALIAAAAIVFAVYFYLQWDEAQTNIDGKISAAEAVAREEQNAIDEARFTEREKEPNRQFTGPGDYGSVSFMYPKTWSVYVERDTTQGGDFVAYFNPAQVNPVGPTTINALRFTIHNQQIDTIRQQYDSLVKAGKLTMSVFQVGDKTGDRYEGEFNNGIIGAMVMLKVNDKTIVIRTDAMVFADDFNKLIETIKY